MFFETSCFPFIRELEERWETIAKEYENVEDGNTAYPETDLYTGEWDVFPLLFFNKDFPKHQKLCPKTWEIVKKIPGVTSASFSILRYNTELKPHTGFTSKVLRCHLPVKIPRLGACALVVDDEPRRWEEGKCLVFDDTFWHYAYNHSETDRVVLLLDFKR